MDCFCLDQASASNIESFSKDMSLDGKNSASTASPHYAQQSSFHPNMSSSSAMNPTKSPSESLTLLESLSLHLSKDGANSLCGAAGGLASGIVTCPLDVIKTKLQAQGAWHSGDGGHLAPSAAAYRGMIGTTRTIWREEGIRGMYRGLTPMILGYLPTWAVWFTVYDRARGFWYREIGQGRNANAATNSDYSESRMLIIAIESEREKFFAHLLASLTAGGTSTMVTNPIWVIKTRLMSQVSRRAIQGARPPWHYKSTWDAARKMYHNEGILSFYSGLTPALLGLTHVAVQFPLYEYFRVKFTGRSMGNQDIEGNESQWLGIFAASILSKVCASSATYPHEVLRTRLQTQQRSFPIVSEEGVAFRGGLVNPGDHGRPPGTSSSDGMRSPPRYRGLVRTFRTILKEEGWRAFYAGMGTNMFRAVPAAVTTMLTFEYTMGRVKRLQAEGKRKMELEHQHIA